MIETFHPTQIQGHRVTVRATWRPTVHVSSFSFYFFTSQLTSCSRNSSNFLKVRIVSYVVRLNRYTRDTTSRPHNLISMSHTHVSDDIAPEQVRCNANNGSCLVSKPPHTPNPTIVIAMSQGLSLFEFD